MATVNLLPNGDGANSPAWTLSSGTDIYAMIDDTGTSPPSSDSSMIYATASGKICSVAFQDLDAGLSDATINSVTAVVQHNNSTRGRTYLIKCTIGRASGDDYIEDTGTVGASISWQTTTFTERTTSDGSNAWTFGDVNDMRMKLDLNAHSGGTTRISYAYLIVDYTAATATDNAIFFGTNF